VKVGDLVRMKPTDSDHRGRVAGVVLKFDVHHPDSSSQVIQIAEILWNTGKSWIDRSRIEAIPQ